jgi:hypothetical protein
MVNGPKYGGGDFGGCVAAAASKKQGFSQLGSWVM